MTLNITRVDSGQLVSVSRAHGCYGIPLKGKFVLFNDAPKAHRFLNLGVHLQSTSGEYDAAISDSATTPGPGWKKPACCNLYYSRSKAKG